MNTLSPAYIETLAAMDARFDATHGSAIPAEDRKFEEAILRRASNSHKSKAVSLTEQLAFRPIASDSWIKVAALGRQDIQRAQNNAGLPGFSTHITSNSRMVQIQTLPMKKRGLFCYVMSDHSVMFARSGTFQAGAGPDIYILPTPLRLADTLTPVGRDIPMKIKGRASEMDKSILNLTVGGHPVTADGWLVEPRLVSDVCGDGPLDDQTSQNFLLQLTAEAMVLEKRLDAIGVYDLTGLTENVGSGTPFARLTSQIAHPIINNVKQAFLARPNPCDDDAHFGELRGNPDDPALPDLVRLFALAVMAADDAIGPKPKQKMAKTRASWLMPNPRTPNSQILVDNADDDTKAVAAKIAQVLGTDAQRLARRFFGYSGPRIYKGDYGDDIALAGCVMGLDNRSGHEKMAVLTEAREIRERLSTHIMDSDGPEKRIASKAVHKAKA